MRHLKRKDGFTLVELVVGIACATMVMAAAASLLLMGARIQRTLRDEAQEQQTVRIVLTMLEDLAADGTIKNVVTTNTGWELNGDTTLLTYDAATGQLKNGTNILLDGLKTAHADLDGQLLTFTFETAQGSYATSTYCRTIKTADTATNVTQVQEKIDNGAIKLEIQSSAAARYEFLKDLCTEYGSAGQIAGAEKYYSTWYAEEKSLANISSWGKGTPWCACFLSWAAVQQGTALSSVPVFANVDEGWKSFDASHKHTTGYTPIPGDYIFFDWEGGDTADPDHDDLDHVGAVLYVNGGVVYTIEGNSGGRVAIHSYALSDPRIYGYGVLNWS